MLTPKGQISVSPEGDSLSISVIWTDSNGPLDRPNVGGWGVGLKHRKLAERLVRAIDAGKAHTGATVKRDVNGKSYVQANAQIRGRCMNADLACLGF